MCPVISHLILKTGPLPFIIGTHNWHLIETMETPERRVKSNQS